MDNSTEEIRQIIPCSNEWVIVYKNRKTGDEYRYPVVCWALVIEHLDDDDKISFERAQFEYVRGLITMQGNHNLVEPLEELGVDEEFIGYEKVN